MARKGTDDDFNDLIEAEAERILAMSDEEVLADTRAKGIDIEATVAKTREMIERAIINAERQGKSVH